MGNTWRAKKMIGIKKELEHEHTIELYQKIKQDGKTEYWKGQDSGRVIMRRDNKIVGTFEGTIDSTRQIDLASF